MGIKKILRKKEFLLFVFTIPAILILLSVIIYPLIYSLSLSFFSYKLSAVHLGKQFIGIKNYIQLFNDPDFWVTLTNTLKLIAGAVSAEFVIGFVIALIMNRRIKGKSLLTTLIVVPSLLCPIIIGMTWRMIFNEAFGIANYIVRLLGMEQGVSWLSNPDIAIYSIMITDIWQWTPFVFLILLAGLSAIPETYQEAAKVDGASNTQRFLYVTLPLMKSSIAVAVLIRIIDISRFFDKIWALTKGGPGISTETSSLFIYMTGFKYFEIGYAAAISWVILIGILILTNILLKVVRKSKR